MELNLPILNRLTNCKNLLIAGMGGGFDIFCGLPIYFELQKLGIHPHLANFSFSDIENVDFGIRLWISPLMSLYWFFEFDCVVQQNMLLPEIEGTMLFRDALYQVIAKAERIPRRKTTNMPL